MKTAECFTALITSSMVHLAVFTGISSFSAPKIALQHGETNLFIQIQSEQPDLSENNSTKEFHVTTLSEIARIGP